MGMYDIMITSEKNSFKTSEIQLRNSRRLFEDITQQISKGGVYIIWIKKTNFLLVAYHGQ